MPPDRTRVSARGYAGRGFGILRRSDPDLRWIGVLTAASIAGRFLTFAFYLLAARSLEPDGFGRIRYTIVLGTLAFALLQVLVSAIGRELGAARGDEDATRGVIGAAMGATAALWVLSAAGVGVAVAAGATGSADPVGIVAVLTALTAHHIYLAVARGVGAMRRTAVTVVVGGVVQVVGLAALALSDQVTSRAALVVWSLALVLPVLVFEVARPIIAGRRLDVSRAAMSRLVALGLPLVAAQALYLAWYSLDQVWVETHLGAHAVGLYGAARNLAEAMILVPAAINAVLMPRVAELTAADQPDRARRLIFWATAGTAVASVGLAAAIVPLRSQLLESLYGDDYRAASAALVAVVLAMGVYATFLTLTNLIVGWGRPGVYVAGIATAAACELALLAAFDVRSPEGAGWASAASIAVGLVVVGATLARRPLRGSPPGVASGPQTEVQ